MTEPPSCHSVGTQCRELRATLRVTTLDGGIKSGDAEATWLLGHTESIDFGELRRSGDQLMIPVVIRVPCRHAKLSGDTVNCSVHGHSGEVSAKAPPKAARQLGDQRFNVVHRGKLSAVQMVEPARRRSLPVTGSPNPCATAKCQTADHKQGAACCRDLQIEIRCPKSNVELERLIRARKAPYLCKVTRNDPGYLDVEVISACGFLDTETGRTCTLHGLRRPDGRSAKPDLCFDWPKVDPENTYHPGCVWVQR